MRKLRVNFKLVWFFEINGLELVWKRKINFDGEEYFVFKYRIFNLEEIVGMLIVWDFIYVCNLKYIVYVWCRINFYLMKYLLFINLIVKYIRDFWIKISKVLNVDKD